jgi:cytoskeleton protein RodZ
MDIGSQLRQAREARGLSLGALAASTRIQPRVLAALERNDLSGVPPAPYARGFVAAYAREVGLDAAGVVRDYFSQFEQQPSPPVAVPSPADHADVDARRGPWIAGVAGAFVLAVVGLLVSGRLPEGGREPAAVGTAGAGRAAVPAVSVDSTPSGGATATSGAVGLAGTAGGPTPAAVPAAMPAPAPEPLVVTLHASGRSWVTATADGTRVVYRTLEAGTTETLRGSREITIRVGNAGALTWSVNGRAGEVMGAPGEVKTVTVGRERP